MAKKGLLDKPSVIDALLTGRYVVETRAGRFVGAFDSFDEAINAGLDDPRASSHTITDPFDAEQIAQFVDRCAGALKDDPRAARALAVLQAHQPG